MCEQGSKTGDAGGCPAPCPAPRPTAEVRGGPAAETSVMKTSLQCGDTSQSRHHECCRLFQTLTVLGLGCSGAGREQCGVPAASVPPHPSQPLHLARRPASPAALLRQPSGAAETGQGGPAADPTAEASIILGPRHHSHMRAGLARPAGSAKAALHFNHTRQTAA